MLLVVHTHSSLLLSVRIIHIIVSVIFVLITLLFFFRAILLLIKRLPFRKFDFFLSYAFLILLYVQFLLGFLLFSFLENNYQYLFLGNNSKMVNQRFWPVEHIVLMIFSIVVAHLGLVLAKKISSPIKKIRTLLIFFSIAILLITFSLCLNYF